MFYSINDNLMHLGFATLVTIIIIGVMVIVSVIYCKKREYDIKEGGISHRAIISSNKVCDETMNYINNTDKLKTQEHRLKIIDIVIKIIDILIKIFKH